MGKKNNLVIISSVFLAFGGLGTFILDLMYKFGNHDTPFIIVLISIIVLIYLHKASYKFVFSLVTTTLICMGISFIFGGTIRVTERLGEWFFLFFVLGLIQYFFAQE